jgi:hypothetical protein
MPANVSTTAALTQLTISVDGNGQLVVSAKFQGTPVGQTLPNPNPGGPTGLFFSPSLLNFTLVRDLNDLAGGDWQFVQLYSSITAAAVAP